VTTFPVRGLYVHIPFCRSKCGYCDFVSAAGREDLIDDYIKALSLEAASFRALSGNFSTLYIGGGTPSLLSPAQLEKLFAAITPLTGPVTNLAESTFEANPESLDDRKAALLKSAGISRISLGLQTWQDGLLKKLGRIAMSADFLKAYGALRAAGFANINADLMCGLPGQRMKDLEESLARLLELEPEHVSLYALEVHKGTPFHAAGVKEAPEEAAEMYKTAAAILKSAGLARYEISNFSLSGREAAHNLNYWEQGEYLGLGTAAASHLDGERRANTTDTTVFIEAALAGSAIPQQYRETLKGRAKRAEKIMLGLRKTAGIELHDDIIIEFSIAINRLLAAGLVEMKDRTLSIREDHLYVSNAVFREFV